MIKIARAHSYAAVEAIRNELLSVPPEWLEAAGDFRWFILPDELSPLFVGLMAHDTVTHDGRLYSSLGAWCAPEECGWICRDVPHIYMTVGSKYSVVHEFGHALARTWRIRVDDWFKPECALYPYAASNADEYFACAIDAFLRSPNDLLFDCGDLQKADPEIYEFLESRR